MYTLLKEVSLQVVLAQEAPYFIIAFAIANFFYKFHSFALETGAFLITWAVLSFIGNALVRTVRGKPVNKSYER